MVAHKQIQRTKKDGDRRREIERAAKKGARERCCLIEANNVTFRQRREKTNEYIRKD